MSTKFCIKSNLSSSCGGNHTLIGELSAPLSADFEACCTKPATSWSSSLSFAASWAKADSPLVSVVFASCRLAAQAHKASTSPRTRAHLRAMGSACCRVQTEFFVLCEIKDPLRTNEPRAPGFTEMLGKSCVDSQTSNGSTPGSKSANGWFANRFFRSSKRTASTVISALGSLASAALLPPSPSLLALPPSQSELWEERSSDRSMQSSSICCDIS
mmetsp:Transcript_61338/g.176524  ORF Transcript_61338/g.176524 Transcript_61338/m.176524 type:complete len:215 (-) Transcript_61338:189-833(-)